MEETLWFLAGVMVVVGYLASLWLWPFTRCRWCDGSGKNPGSNRKRWGDCRRCGGGGKRVRLGTRILYRRD